MELLTCARPYAKAAFDYAVEAKKVDEWLEALIALSGVVQHEKISYLLTLPSFSALDHVRILSDLLQEEPYFDPYVERFLKQLAHYKRIPLLPSIARHFKQYWNEAKDRQECRVYSAVPLNGDQITSIEKKMHHHFKKSMDIENIVDPLLLGGVKICTGDWVYDGTLRARLKELKKAITL